MSNPLQPSVKIRLFNGKRANLDDFKSAGLVAFGKDFMDIEGCVGFPVTYSEEASLLSRLSFTIEHFGDILLYYLYIGQSVQFYGGYYDENNLDFQRVFTGTVTRIKTRFSNTGRISISVECMSYGFTKMGKDAKNFVYPDSQSSRKFAQMSNLTVEQVVRGIIEENGFSVGEISLPSNGSLPKFDNRNPKYQKEMTDWQFLNSLADEVGCSMWMSTEEGRDKIYFMSKDKAFHRQSSDISFVYKLDGKVNELKDSEIIKARNPAYNRPRMLMDCTVEEDVAAANSVTRSSMRYNKDTGEYEELMSKIEVDKDGNESEVVYSPYTGGMYAAPTNRMSGSVNFTLGNNLEMKWKDKEDSVHLVSLIDDLTANMSYDFAAKENPLSDLNLNIRIKLSKSYTFSTNARFSSYVYEADSVGATPRRSAHTTYWEQGRFGRFQGMSQGINYTLDNNKVLNFIKRLKGEKVDDKKDNKKNKKGGEDEDEWDPDLDTNIDKDMSLNKDSKTEGKSKAETDEDGYMAFKMPWSLTFSYNINMHESTDVKKFNYDKMQYPYEFTQSLNFHGNIRLSDGWNINLNSGYDFNYKKISMTTASLSRDLHCFNMSCTVQLAPYTSYNFSFRCNASTLTDALKYDKRSSFSNAVQWY